MARTRIPSLLLALGLCLSPSFARIRPHPDAYHPYHAAVLAVPRGGGGLGPLGARRPATTVPSGKQGSGFSSTRQQQKQQQQISAKEAMNSFLTRDSRNTFIGMYVDRRTSLGFFTCIERQPLTPNHPIALPFLSCIHHQYCQLASTQFSPFNCSSRPDPSCCSVSTHS